MNNKTNEGFNNEKEWSYEIIFFWSSAAYTDLVQLLIHDI